MSTSILPNAAQSAVSNIDNLNKRFVQNTKAHRVQVANILANTKGDDGKTLLTQAQIIAAAGGRFDELPGFLSAIDGVLAIAVPAATAAPASN